MAAGVKPVPQPLVPSEVEGRVSTSLDTNGRGWAEVQ